jgi:hypothetical protein
MAAALTRVCYEDEIILAVPPWNAAAVQFCLDHGLLIHRP